MADEPVRRAASSPPVARGHRYRRHELELAGGGRLILGVDGTIDHLDADGSTRHSWMPDDPEWPGQAIRFGLHPQAPTITPQGRSAQATRPPRG